jgi:Transposase family tnp2
VGSYFHGLRFRTHFGNNEGVGSRFHVLRAPTHFWRYRGRRIPFSGFARPDSFSTVPRVSCPVFMFCAPGLIFGDAECDGSCFHVLCIRTHFRRYRGRRDPFSRFALPDSFGYGMLCGWTTQGRLACPICIEDTKALKLEGGGKLCWFDCHRRFLPEHHPFHFQEDSFKKNTIELDPPSRLTGKEIFERISSLD